MALVKSAPHLAGRSVLSFLAVSGSNSRKTLGSRLSSALSHVLPTRGSLSTASPTVVPTGTGGASAAKLGPPQVGVASATPATGMVIKCVWTPCWRGSSLTA